ncbi:MAG: hypothetical protein ACRCYT_06915 [Cetobacterium sp.]
MNDVKIKFTKTKKMVMIALSSDERYYTYTIDYDFAEKKIAVETYRMVSSVVDNYKDLDIINIALDEDVRNAVNATLQAPDIDGYFLEKLKEMV